MDGEGHHRGVVLLHIDETSKLESIGRLAGLSPGII